jgi:hypothetical protein
MRKPLALTVAAAALITIAVAGTALASHSWGKYHWARTANPFTLTVGDNVSSAWDSYLDEAVADWSASTVLDLSKAAGGSNPSTCPPTAGRIEACNANYGATGWLGIAQIWIQRGARGQVHITQATTRVNDYYFNQAQYNTPAWRRLVMCQEIAHDFGLDHQDENFNNANLGSCMDYTSDPDGPPSNEHPNAHDFEQLLRIYGHVDSSSTVGAGAPDDLPGNAPPFSQASRANGSVYVDQLANDGRLITYVFWTPFGD